VPEGRLLILEERTGKRTVDVHEVASSLNIEYETIRRTEVGKFRLALTSWATDMIEQKSRMLLDELDKAVTEAGNVFSAGGKALDFDIFLKALRKLDPEFFTHHARPALLCSPETGDQVERLQEEWLRDPEKKRRLDDLWNQKREEWRDRESARKLVD